MLVARIRVGQRSTVISNNNIVRFLREDLSSSALEEAKEQWEKHGKPFTARFCELNPCMVITSPRNTAGNQKLEHVKLATL